MDTTLNLYDIQAAKRHGKTIYFYMLSWSLAFLLAVPFACIYSGEGLDVFYDLYLILISPCNLITDYFNIGGLGSTLLNAALCGLACNLIIFCSHTPAQARVLAGYFLVTAHCFYGLNILNMWPPFFGVYIYCRVTKKPFSENMHIAMFSTALAPFVSDFLFRYTAVEDFVFGKVNLTVSGVILALAFGLAAGFSVPAILSATLKIHRGFSLYKAGLAIGLFGMFVYSFFYKTLGIEAPGPSVRHNILYDQNEGEYTAFMNVFFILIFTASIVTGFILNGKSFQGYWELLKSTGYNVDFIKSCGAPDSIINIGIFGLFIVLYFNITFLISSGVAYTGPTSGVIIAAVTFSASGQTPKNVWPIGLGYFLLNIISLAISTLEGFDFNISLNTQAYINSFAFATGLCPFAGKYGWKIGVAAGMINAVICTSTSALHGGFVLYNGGFTAGLTALVLLTLLDFYDVRVKH